MAAGQKAEGPPVTMAKEAEVVSGDGDRDLRKVFSLYDKDGDDRISASELGALVACLGKLGRSAASRGAAPPADDDEVALMMKELDIDGDGFVDFREFAAFFAHHDGGSGGEKEGGARKEEEERQLRDAFEVYDLDGNGRISAKELHRVMKSLGDKCSYADCCRMISSVDADGDRQVNFEEFKKMFAGGGPLSPGGGDAGRGSKGGSGEKKNKKR